MLTIGQELTIFLEAVLSGIIVLASYNVLRALRRLIRHGIVMISLEDAVFWIAASVYLFVQIYKTSDGSIRWFFVAGVVMGMLVFVGVSSMVWHIYSKIKKCIEKE